jgi:hypothetical protein
VALRFPVLASSLVSTSYIMPIDFYYVLASAPCRSILLLAKALKVELNLKVTNLSKGENKTPEFLKVQYKRILLNVYIG